MNYHNSWKKFIDRSAYLNEMKSWDSKKYKEFIYNEEYSKIDQGYNGERANIFSKDLFELLNKFKCNKILDYGGGRGYLTDLLKEKGFDSYSYDMFDRKDLDEKDVFNNTYDACLAVEVLEHELDPLKLWDAFNKIIKKDGYLFCTTEFLDNKNIQNWYYANPRAGHNLLYSKKSFEMMASKNGFEYISDINQWHILKKVK